MKGLLGFSCVAVAITFLANTAAADFSPPAGLNAGDTFHWAFVTSTSRDATSSNIADYNAHVNVAASALPDAGNAVNGVSGVSFLRDINWFAIASTPTVDARDNIGDPLSPIYRFDGVRVANNEADLFDGSSDPLLAPISVTEQGVSVFDSVWTGTDTAGLAADFSAPSWSVGSLGAGAVYTVFGLSGASDWQWVGMYTPGPSYQGIRPPTLQFPLYAISEPLTVVPVPGSFILGALGLATTSALHRRRRRRTEVADSTR